MAPKNPYLIHAHVSAREFKLIVECLLRLSTATEAVKIVGRSRQAIQSVYDLIADRLHDEWGIRHFYSDLPEADFGKVLSPILKGGFSYGEYKALRQNGFTPPDTQLWVQIALKIRKKQRGAKEENLYRIVATALYLASKIQPRGFRRHINTELAVKCAVAELLDAFSINPLTRKNQTTRRDRLTEKEIRDWKELFSVDGKYIFVSEATHPNGFLFADNPLLFPRIPRSYASSRLQTVKIKNSKSTIGDSEKKAQL